MNINQYGEELHQHQPMVKLHFMQIKILEDQPSSFLQEKVLVPRGLSLVKQRLENQRQTQRLEADLLRL
jgi:hypothetical protein